MTDKILKEIKSLEDQKKLIEKEMKVLERKYMLNLNKNIPHDFFTKISYEIADKETHLNRLNLKIKQLEKQFESLIS